MLTKRPLFRGLALALGGAMAWACASARPPAPVPSAPPPEAATRRPAADAELRNATHVYVAELGAELDVFPTVFRPRNKSGCLSQVQARPGDSVLDIGTGTGLIGLLTAKQGARRVVATGPMWNCRPATVTRPVSRLHPVLPWTCPSVNDSVVSEATEQLRWRGSCHNRCPFR